MDSWHIPHWQVHTLSQLEQLLITPDHPTSNDPLPLGEFLPRYAYIAATTQLHGDWDKPDSDFELLPQQLIEETPQFPVHGVHGAPLLSALRHPSIMKRFDAYAEYVRYCYTLVFEKFDWVELAKAVLRDDAHYIMQFASLFNAFDGWLTGDTVLAIKKWRSHELVTGMAVRLRGRRRRRESVYI